MLTKEQFRAAANPAAFPSEIVPLPLIGDGGEVRIRALSASERDYLERKIGEESDSPRSRAILIGLAACNADGSRMFEEADVDWLAGLPAAAIEPAVEVALRLAGMGRSGKEAARKN